ncbi:MAG: hypothetical protein KH434_04830 [Clostridium sp.]|nr:hypothetical protein [Clostridium sp.]
MNKGIKISIIIAILVVIVGIVGFIIFKPTLELNKAVEYLKDGNYKEAYSYVNNKNNEKNKTIIRELNTSIFCDRAGNGINKVTEIVKQCTNIINKVDMNDIDYSLDDNINIYVESLDDYISLENELSKDMISSELQETYDVYFSIIKYMRENYYDVLNHIKDEKFIKETNDLANKMTRIANDCYSYADNHKFQAKTQDIYKEIKQYIVK